MRGGGGDRGGDRRSRGEARGRGRGFREGGGGGYYGREVRAPGTKRELGITQRVSRRIQEIIAEKCDAAAERRGSVLIEKKLGGEGRFPSPGEYSWLVYCGGGGVVGKEVERRKGQVLREEGREGIVVVTSRRDLRKQGPCSRRKWGFPGGVKGGKTERGNSIGAKQARRPRSMDLVVGKGLRKGDGRNERSPIWRKGAGV